MAQPKSRARRNTPPSSMCPVSCTALSFRARSRKAVSRVSIGAPRWRCPACSKCLRTTTGQASRRRMKNIADEAASPGSPFRPLYDDQILFAGQPIALVVAEEFEIARLAATLVDIEYEAEEAITDFDTQLDKAFSPPKKRLPGWDPEPRGDADKALSQAPIQHSARISHPDRAPQSHGMFRDDGGLRRRWTPHRL